MDALDGDSETAARISTYELAFRMQSSAPEAVDLSKETAAARRVYGLDRKPTTESGTRCLLDRRLIERGVRFIQLYSAAGRSLCNGTLTKIWSAIMKRCAV